MSEPSFRLTRRQLVSGAATTALVFGSGLVAAAQARASGDRLPAPGYVPGDKFFGKAYIDIDEWRNEPVRFRYVHGGFEGTDARFSFYFPERALYQKRFFHTLQGGTGGSENTVLDAITAYNQFGVVAPQALLAAFDCGGYLIESNQGHLGDDLSGVKNDNTILCYRTSAQTAMFARLVARSRCTVRLRRTVISTAAVAAQRARSPVWSMSKASGTPACRSCARTNHRAHSFRFRRMRCVCSAVKNQQRTTNADGGAGGSGNPFAGLDNEQAEAMRILLETGHPRHIGLDNPVEQVVVWSYTAWDMDRARRPDLLGRFLEQARLSRPRLAAGRLARRNHVQFTSRVKRLLTARELQALKSDPDFVDELGMGPMAAMLAQRARGADARLPWCSKIAPSGSRASAVPA